MKILGVAKDQPLSSMGTVTAQLDFNGIMITHEFHVMNKNLNLSADVVLGNDILLKGNALIDYLNKSLTIRKIDEKSNQQINSQNLQNKIRNVSIFTAQGFKKLENTKETGNFNEYHNAVEEYRNYENRKYNIRMFSGTKFKNENFYEELPSQIFDQFDDLNTQKLNMEEENDFMPLNENKLKQESFINNENIQNQITDKYERLNYLMDKMDLNHLGDEYKEKIKEICYEYSDAFYVDSDILTPTNAYVHSIKLKPNVDAVHIKQYRIPEGQKEEIERQIKDLEDKRIIEKSTSRFNSPLLLVKKAPDGDGKPQFRLVLDYRKVNDATIPQAYPIPLIEEIIDQMHDVACFTKLDVQSAFHQIMLDEKCRHITAFSTTYNHYQFRTVPFGLQSAPVAWLYTINRVLQKFINRNLFTYMDDIVLVNKDQESNILLLKQVLKQLIRFNIKLKPEKCALLQPSIKYLGFKLSKNGVEVDENKISCVKKYPTPKNVTEVQRFVGFVNFYRKHIYDFSKIARPLYNLCKKDQTFEWTTECEEAFQTLKFKLMNPPVLIYPRFDYPFVITSDASKVAIAAILSNKIDGEERPIQYFSKTLNSAQRNYSTIELELFAIIASIRHWSCYLHNKFYVVSDHKPIEYLFNSKNNSSRIHRWRLELLEFQFEVAYRKGKLNVCADALSRIEIENDPEIEEELKSIFMVTTRAKVKENEMKSSESTKQTKIPIKKRIELFFIEEKNNLMIESSNYDHIFFCIDQENCKIHKQLQYRLKKKINVNDLKFGELLSIDNNKSIIKVSKVIKIDTDRENTESGLKVIHAITTQRQYEHIAINIDPIDTRSHFEFKYILKKLFTNSNISITIYLNRIIEITEVEEINSILFNFHNTKLGGHASYEKMIKSIRRFYKWHNMNSDVKNYIKKCEICQKNKISRHTHQPLVISSIPLSCFATLFIDHVGPINPVNQHGNPYILTCICDLSKFAITMPVPDTSAETTARNLVEKVFLTFGFPEKLVSDNFSSFTSETLKEICKILKIKQIFSSPYHPQSNVVERYHRTLGNYLRAFVSNDPVNWQEALPYATSSYNQMIHSSTNYTPFELVFGRVMQPPSSLLRNNVPLYNYDNFACELKSNLSKTWQLAKEQLLRKKEENKKKYDVTHKAKNLNINIGDEVFVLRPSKTHKYDAPYEGPYPVVEITGENTLRIRKNNKNMRVHKDKLKKKQD